MTPSFRLALALSLAMLWGRSASAEQKPYTLADLQALQQKKAWPELIAHLQDVPPAERQADWNRVVESACLQPGQMESSQATYCLENLRAVLAAEPTNVEFAWKAGKWTRLNNAPWTAVPFFAKSVTKAQDAHCKDEDLQLAVVAALGLPKEVNGDVVKDGQTLAFQTCWPDTKTAVKQAFTNASSAFRANTCTDLQQKKALSNLQSKRCSEK